MSSVIWGSNLKKQPPDWIKTAGGKKESVSLSTSYQHQPVLSREVLDNFAFQGGETVIDATCGLGGHAQLIAKKIGKKGTLLLIDRDQQALTVAQKRLVSSEAELIFCHSDFKQIDQLAKEKLNKPAHAILFDFGLNSSQLDNPARGFSFQKSGPLDMRMDRSQGKTLAELLESSTADQLSWLIKEYGEERYAKRVARAILEALQKKGIDDTASLAKVISRAIPGAHQQKINPATRTFQALRIAINDELQQIEEALFAAAKILADGGKLQVISFHSLEDRICKRVFKMLSEKGYSLPFRKPLQASAPEKEKNSRSRSAKLRMLQKNGIN